MNGRHRPQEEESDGPPPLSVPVDALDDDDAAAAAGGGGDPPGDGDAIERQKTRKKQRVMTQYLEGTPRHSQRVSRVSQSFNGSPYAPSSHFRFHNRPYYNFIFVFYR